MQKLQIITMQKLQINKFSRVNISNMDSQQQLKFVNRGNSFNNRRQVIPQYGSTMS